MNEYTLTMNALSTKKITIRAQSSEEALSLVEQLLTDTDILDFTDDDIDEINISCEGDDDEDFDLCDDCDDCILACPGCGCCTCP